MGRNVAANVPCGGVRTSSSRHAGVDSTTFDLVVRVQALSASRDCPQPARSTDPLVAADSSSSGPWNSMSIADNQCAFRAPAR